MKNYPNIVRARAPPPTPPRGRSRRTRQYYAIIIHGRIRRRAGGPDERRSADVRARGFRPIGVRGWGHTRAAAGRTVRHARARRAWARRIRGIGGRQVRDLNSNHNHDASGAIRAVLRARARWCVCETPCLTRGAITSGRGCGLTNDIVWMHSASGGQSFTNSDKAQPAA